ncbi:MAG: ATPase [Clostridioides sp.]|nr:ATPase [Clostridioides sp.]
MAVEALEKIQQAESNAKSIVDDAMDQSRKILSQAETKANQEYQKIVDQAKEEAVGIRNDATNRGNLQSQPIIAKGEKEVEAILSTSGEKIDQAVKLVIERIVKFNGNS